VVRASWVSTVISQVWATLLHMSQRKESFTTQHHKPQDYFCPPPGNMICLQL
jgi:hypothetical protein